MARGGTDDLVRLSLYGVVGVAAWQMAVGGHLGAAVQQQVQQLRQRIQGWGAPSGGGGGSGSGGSGSGGGGGAPSATPACASGGPWYPVASGDGQPFLDMGNVPVEWNGSRLRQVCAQGGTNEYRPGDVFQWTGTGGLFVWEGGWSMRPVGGGGGSGPELHIPY